MKQANVSRSTYDRHFLSLEEALRYKWNLLLNARVAAEWLKRGMKEPPVQMAEILVHIVMLFTSGQTA